MTHYPLVTGILLGGAVALAAVSALGVAVMRDALQRLHFSATVVSLSMLLAVIAVWLEDDQAEARIKVILTATVLFWTNPILTHVTARAVRIRQSGHWAVRPSDPIEVMGAHSEEER
jgi:monovalent cation/proton antiporter MnhG/PhaG subunit